MRVAQLIGPKKPRRRRTPVRREAAAPASPSNRAVGQLGFEGPEVERITNGTKTATIRPAGRAPAVGKVVPLRHLRHKPAFARAEILSVRPLNRRTITEGDARAAGRTSVRELRDDLRARYPEGNLVIIEFRLVAS